MPRPETLDLSKGDRMLISSSGGGFRFGPVWHRPRVDEVTIVGLGRVWVTVIATKDAESYFADPDSWKWRTRKFLRADMREGVPARRVGTAATLVTREQHEYDVDLARADWFLRGIGFDVRNNRDAPMYDPDRRRQVIELIVTAWPDLRDYWPE